MSKVVGRFYFRQTINGNLVGEYSNDGDYSFPECAYLTADGESRANVDAFVGDYRTTWIEEPESTSVSADLTITLKTIYSNLYKLTWDTGEVVFHGEAMLAEAGLLVGNYYGG